MVSRREILRIGALSLFSPLVGLECATPARSSQAGRKDRNAIFILLQGGPSHIDLWDPKPQAIEQVRGPFKTIATALPGLQFGELLQQTAKVAKHLAVVRSVEHRFTNHIGGTYITLTGSTNQPDADRDAAAEDFPGPGAVLNYLRTTPTKAPLSVSLPNWLSIPGPSNRMPGQYGGFLGSVYDPFLVAGDPNKSDFKPLTLTLPGDMNPDRLAGRASLRKQLDAATRVLENQGTRSRDRLNETAYQLLINPAVRVALDLSREPEKLRDRYGRTKIGQSLLLARRLIEAGIRYVAYNEFNQHWDHHSDIQGSLKRCVPPMEQAYSALIGDLVDRGLLDQTLVVTRGSSAGRRLSTKNAAAILGRMPIPRSWRAEASGAGRSMEAPMREALMLPRNRHPRPISWPQCGNALASIPESNSATASTGPIPCVPANR